MGGMPVLRGRHDPAEDFFENALRYEKTLLEVALIKIQITELRILHEDFLQVRRAGSIVTENEYGIFFQPIVRYFFSVNHLFQPAEWLESDEFSVIKKDLVPVANPARLISE